MAMARTKHYGARVSQRGIRESTVELAQLHGVIVVECGGALITAYDFDSFNRY